MRTKQSERRLIGQTNWKQELMRFLPAIMMIAFCTFNTFAVGADSAFEKVTSEIQGYIKPVQSLIYVIAAVISLVGAFNIYHKMTNGDQDVKKTIMLTIGGCIALVALSTALPTFFGHTSTGG